MSASVILYAVAAICFLLAVLEVGVGELALVPLGLLFIAAGLVVERLGFGASITRREHT